MALFEIKLSLESFSAALTDICTPLSTFDVKDVSYVHIRQTYFSRDNSLSLSLYIYIYAISRVHKEYFSTQVTRFS